MGRTPIELSEVGSGRSSTNGRGAKISRSFDTSRSRTCSTLRKARVSAKRGERRAQPKEVEQAEDKSLVAEATDLLAANECPTDKEEVARERCAYQFD